MASIIVTTKLLTHDTTEKWCFMNEWGVGSFSINAPPGNIWAQLDRVKTPPPFVWPSEPCLPLHQFFGRPFILSTHRPLSTFSSLIAITHTKKKSTNFEGWNIKINKPRVKPANRNLQQLWSADNTGHHWGYCCSHPFTEQSLIDLLIFFLTLLL